MNRILLLITVFFLVSCGGSNSSGDGSNQTPQPSSTSPPTPSIITINVSGAANGIFDPAPVNDGSGTLWMSFSIVDSSQVDPVLPHISTRIASSTDQGLTWIVDPVAPNSPSDIQVPDGSGGMLSATWHYEVSRLAYDPFATNPNHRWKLFWHRYLEANVNGTGVRLFEHGWIGASTAPSPSGPWSSERKLFIGTGYKISNNSTIGIAEYDLATLFPAVNDLGMCIAFTEPGIIANNDGLYISLKCAENSSGEGKVVLIKCDNALSTNSCSYIGSFINDTEASQFSNPGQNLTGFSATELVTIASKSYLIVTPTGPPTEAYRGCLIFEISDITTAQLVRNSTVPFLVKRVEGTAGSFNGACGYTDGASASGIFYSEFNNTIPRFRIFASKVNLP